MKKKNYDLILGAVVAATVTGAVGGFIWWFSRKATRKQRPPAGVCTAVEGPATAARAHLPVVDLEADREQILRQLHQACTSHGFFYITNHGIPGSLQRRVLQQARGFFALPLEHKLQLLVDKNNRGFSPTTADRPHGAKSSKASTAKPISKESFFIGREVANSSADAADYMQGLNQWPDATLLPGFKEDMDVYFKLCWELSVDLTHLLLESLDVDTRVLAEPGVIDRPMLLMRLLHYDSTLSDPKQEVFAANPHTDYGILTILANDDNPGLQLQIDQQWVDVPPLEGALIVNLGDMLQRWTADLYQSTTHRVLQVSGKDRYSIPFFFEPNLDCSVKALLGGSEGEGVRYRDHLKAKHDEAQAAQL